MANGFINDDFGIDGAISTTGVSFDGGTNVLEAYSEGTFTPTFYGGTTAGTGTYTAQYGFYTTVGDRCMIDYYCRISSHTGTGTLYANIPFTIKSVTGFNGTGSYHGQVVNHTNGAINVTSKFLSGTQFFLIKECIDNAPENSINIQSVNNFQFYASAAYLLP